MNQEEFDKEADKAVRGARSALLGCALIVLLVVAAIAWLIAQ